MLVVPVRLNQPAMLQSAWWRLRSPLLMTRSTLAAPAVPISVREMLRGCCPATAAGASMTEATAPVPWIFTLPLRPEPEESVAFAA